MALTIATLVRHEPYFDEAQQWLVARDSGPLELVLSVTRHEGHPPLWDLILMPFAHAGLPFFSQKLIGAGCALTGTFLFVRLSPFPAAVRALYPLCFWALYQYAIVVRPYCMLALVLFGVAYLHRERTVRPVAYTLLLVLLVLVDVAGIVIALTFTCMDGLQAWRRWPQLTRSARRNDLLRAAAVALVSALLVALLWPASDAAPFAANRPFRFDLGSLWQTTVTMVPGGLSPAPMISLAALAVTCWWFWLTKTLSLYVLPAAALLAIYGFKYHNVWHEGILFLLWVAVAWISLSTPQVRPGNRPKPRRWAPAVAVGTTLALQLPWSFNSVRYDLLNSYSGARAAAVYIHAHRMDQRKVYATSFHSIAILPYFESNIFANYHHGRRPAYWDWSLGNDMGRDYPQMLRDNPDVFVYGVKFADQLPLPPFPGYRLAAVIRGDLYWKDRLLEPENYYIFERA